MNANNKLIFLMGSFMKASMHQLRLPALAATAAIMTGCASAPVQIAGTQCVTPPPEHCAAGNCDSKTLSSTGSVVDAKTGRKYFLDYPCDLKKGEKVTFIMSLHGGGSYGNWQRNYFPLMDYKDKYRLVIATPNAPPRMWMQNDDEHLQNIVNFVYEQIGEENIKAFWLVGHSQGGMTSNRIVRTDFFKQRVDGFLSLSGGRLGGNPGRATPFGPIRTNTPASQAASLPASSMAAMAAQMAALQTPPDANISFIYTTGVREMDDKGLPATSTWANKFNCSARVKRDDVIDSKAGYVYDGTAQNPPNPSWGLLPGPGKAEVYVYPNCKDGRVVADVVRLEKGHTEGLEPHVTEELVKLMLSAKPVHKR
jgi:hypothetical protein